MADFFYGIFALARGLSYRGLSGRVWEEKAKIAAFEERCDEDK